MARTYDCDKHSGQRGISGYCPDCLEAFANRRDPDLMTGEERAAEFRWWGEILTIPFVDLTQRIEELIGRGVWTHELAHPEMLIEEARTRQHPTPQEILDKIPSHKRIIVQIDD